MDVVAYLGTVVAICGLAIGAVYVIVGLLGKRIDDLRTDLDARFSDLRTDLDARFGGMDVRLARLEQQNDSIIDAVAGLGDRVTRLEVRGA